MARLGGAASIRYASLRVPLRHSGVNDGNELRNEMNEGSKNPVLTLGFVLQAHCGLIVAPYIRSGFAHYERIR